MIYAILIIGFIVMWLTIVANRPVEVRNYYYCSHEQEEEFDPYV